MHAIVHPADIQDRDGGGLVMATLFGLYPFLLKLYADGGYQGPVFQNAVKAAMANLNVEIVKRSDRRKVSWLCRSDGWLNEPSHGLTDAVGWPKIGSVSIAKPGPMCCLHPFGSWSEG